MSNGSDDLASLPPSIVRDVAQRLDGFDERLAYIGEQTSETYKGVGGISAELVKLSASIAAQQASLNQSLNAHSGAMLELRADVEILINELRSTRLELARQGGEIDRLKDRIAVVEKKVSMLPTPPTEPHDPSHRPAALPPPRAQAARKR